jgi:hypothetical protein
MTYTNNTGPSEKRKDSHKALKALEVLLKDSEQKKITYDQVMIILDALAGSDDPQLVARFPVVLAICAQKGFELDSQTLFSRHWEMSPKRQNLEKLLLVTGWLFRLEKLDSPKNLDKIIDTFKTKYRDLLSGEFLQLSSGRLVSIQDIHNSLKRYSDGLNAVKERPVPGRSSPSAQLYRYLDRLFSPKQKDLVLKRIDGKSFTKTEREYYSRVVRKKLEAIADDGIRNIAVTLTLK